MNIDKMASSEPVFDFREYFLGYTKASGWFSDRFGKVRKHFCGDFFGSYEGDVFVLDEKLYYTDGIVESRQWRVTISDKGEFNAESEALVGNATGLLKGNALQLAYRMNVEVANGKKWLLSMDDWMFYQADGSLHNMTNVSKWGMRVGTVSTQYIKPGVVSEQGNSEELSPAGCRQIAANS